VLRTFFTNRNSQVTIICPDCGSSRTTDASKFKNANKEVTATCKCGTKFKFIVEFRKHYRKKVKLPGEYVIPSKKGLNQMLVEDISVSGLGFITLDPHGIRKDDIFEVNFRLDNAKKSEIHKQVVAMTVRDRFVGVKFLDKSNEQDLGFYLMR
jgi:hypothetical protein